MFCFLCFQMSELSHWLQCSPFSKIFPVNISENTGNWAPVLHQRTIYVLRWHFQSLLASELEVIPNLFLPPVHSGITLCYYVNLQAYAILLNWKLEVIRKIQQGLKPGK